MAAALSTRGLGRVADYIPALATADPNAFGMALATVEGEIYGVGDCEQPFSIQSISKLFTLALVLTEGGDGLWRALRPWTNQIRCGPGMRPQQIGRAHV